MGRRKVVVAVEGMERSYRGAADVGGIGGYWRRAVQERHGCMGVLRL